MNRSIQILEKALEKKTATEWAKTLNITPETFSMAKKQGRVSPVLAGNLAIELGEDVAEWMMTAALESERKDELLSRLKSRVNNWRKR